MSGYRTRVMSLRVPAVIVAALAAWIAASPAVPAAQRADQNAVRVLPVRGNIYMIAGAGANITAQIGSDGVLLVDSGSGAHSRSGTLIAAIRKPTDRPIRWIINTHFHPDHVGGNGAIATAGENASPSSRSA